MKSVAGITKKVNGETFKSISIEEAQKLQEQGTKLYQIDNLKSIS